MNFQEMIAAAMGPDWVPPTPEEIAERQAREAHEALMSRSFKYYDRHRTARAYKDGRMVEMVYCWKQGRNRTDTDGQGTVLHLRAMEDTRNHRLNWQWQAICGTMPGRRSGGWSNAGGWVDPDDVPICKRCAARLKRMNALV